MSRYISKRSTRLKVMKPDADARQAKPSAMNQSAFRSRYAQAKGKIERRFDTFQKRLVTLLSYEQVTDYDAANHLLLTQIDWHNQNADCTLDFLGQNAPITPTQSKIVTVVHRPNHCFWVVPYPPSPDHPAWPPVLAHYRL